MDDGNTLAYNTGDVRVHFSCSATSILFK